MIQFLIETLCILLLSIPLFWEVFDDGHGDQHVKGADDWILRGLLMLVCSVAVWFIGYYWRLHDHVFIEAFVLSFFIFLSIFPYLVNIRMYRRKVISDPKWWSYLSSSRKAKPDGWQWWRHTPWPLRMLMYAALLAVAIKFYVCWESILSYYAC